MITLIGDQTYAIFMMALLLALPGWAIGRIVELQLAVPKILLPPAWFAFGLTLWTIAITPSLALGISWRLGFVIHAIVTIFLILVAKELHRRRGQAKPQGGDVAYWTVGGVLAAGLLAAVLRTRMSFDTIFHVGIVRRIAELTDPTFANVDRVLDAGVNPSYAVPSWQAAMAMVSGVTGLDPATVVESMAALAVVLAACATAGLGRMVSGRVAGEVAGVAAYAWLRVFFPRRELEGDGVAYAALPGNLTLDVLLPLILVAVLAIAIGGPGAPVRRRGAVALGIVATAMLVVLHANYIVYVAIIGLGMLGWMWAAGSLRGDGARRMLRAALVVAVPAAIAMVALLPVLMQLEQFANPVEARIDYHLIGSGAWELIRPGHLYDWFAAPGLLAMLALPYAAWRTRGTSQALLAGGALAMILMALVPPLVDAMDATGSRTIGIRLPRPMGVLLAAALAVAIPAGIDAMRGVVERVRLQRGAWIARLLAAAPFVAVLAVAGAYGYPMARREPPSYGWDWPTIVAGLGLIVVLVLMIRARRGEPTDDASPFAQDDAIAPKGRRTMVAITGLSVLALGICLLPSGYVSLRRGAWQSRELVASYRADDLGCLSGVQRELRGLKAGGVLLADPVTAYTAQALTAQRILADYKVWNGKTDSTRADQRVEQLRRLFDSEDADAARDALADLEERYHARYLLVAEGRVEPPLGSTIGAFDAVGLRELLDSGVGTPELLASGQGRTPAGATKDERAACNLSLYRIRPAAQVISAEAPT